LHENDQDALIQLCAIYNNVRDRILSTHKQNQGIPDGIEAHMASEIEQLHELRDHVMECLELAQEEIYARSSEHTNTVMCVSSPRYLLLACN
jgi:hypothetical protein